MYQELEKIKVQNIVHFRFLSNGPGFFWIRELHIQLFLFSVFALRVTVYSLDTVMIFTNGICVFIVCHLPNLFLHFQHNQNEFLWQKYWYCNVGENWKYEINDHGHAVCICLILFQLSAVHRVEHLSKSWGVEQMLQTGLSLEYQTRKESRKYRESDDYVRFFCFFLSSRVRAPAIFFSQLLQLVIAIPSIKQSINHVHAIIDWVCPRINNNMT